MAKFKVSKICRDNFCLTAFGLALLGCIGVNYIMMPTIESVTGMSKFIIWPVLIILSLFPSLTLGDIVQDIFLQMDGQDESKTQTWF